MIAGDPLKFAVEFGITQAYERLSLRALGYFVIYICGQQYGQRSPESTMLACSFDEVGKRIRDRGRHQAPFAPDATASDIADALIQALYSDHDGDRQFLGLSRQEFAELVQSNDLLWAPDGDSAFDDGSYVLQFDVGDRARIVAFRSQPGYVHDATTLADLWLPAEDFYCVIREWRDAFAKEWEERSKVSATG